MSEDRTEPLAAPRVNMQRTAVAAEEAPRQPGPSQPPPQIPPPQAHSQRSATPPQAQAKGRAAAHKLRRRGELPGLEDDADVGIEKQQLVTRDEKPDLLFMGVLLASAAPASAPSGSWNEYRIYRTSGGKHVFSKVTRTVLEDRNDSFAAEVFDPAPSSMPSQLLKGAREIAHGRPLTWKDAAVAFFGYDPLAKVLYRKLSVGFEERIT